MRPPPRLAMIIALALALTAIGAATGWLVLRRDPFGPGRFGPDQWHKRARRTDHVGHRPAGRGALDHLEGTVAGRRRPWTVHPGLGSIWTSGRMPGC